MKDRKVNVRHLFFIGLAVVGAGCGSSPPENPKPADGSNPNVMGKPQERIANIEADTTLTPEERARRIQLIKERNHLQ